jgi:predicted site-specific integrase-resolvase
MLGCSAVSQYEARMTPLLNASALAKALCVTCTTITAWVKKKIIPVEIHEGRIYRFDVTKVKAALAERAARREDA